MNPVPTRVLLVEDNPADVRLLEEALREVPAHGVILTKADTLAAALLRLESDGPDIALLDLSLPDAEGLDILYSAQAKAPRVPLVVLTGRDDSELALQAVRDGAQDYLVKGRLDGQLLVRSLRYAIERKRSRDALEHRELHFRRLIENASDLIAVVNTDWEVKYVSPSLERILGYPVDAVVGTRLSALIHPDDAAAVQQVFEKAIANEGQPQISEHRERCQDGSWRVMEGLFRSLLQDPVVAGVVINSHDVTERKQSAETLRDLNARLEAVIDNAPLAIFRIGINGTVESWNKGAERIFGWTEQETVGRPLPMINESVQAEFVASLARARRGEVEVQSSLRRQRKNGTMLDVNLWTAPLRGDTGEVQSVLGIVADVTEQKLLEEQFRHAQKMEAVGRLAGGVAHDFNNLLTVITGYTQLALKRLPADGGGVAEMGEVLAASDRAASLTKQLLALSRRQIVELAHVDVNHLIAEVERMLRRMLGEDIEIETRYGKGLKAVRVDRPQIELVLLNLAVNARDAMPAGGTLRIETQPLGDSVGVRVSDNGTGMPPAVLERMFEPFFTTKEEGKGTGLGLSTSLGIIRQHGGDIDVQSAVGSGTTFLIRLPAAHSPAQSLLPVDQEAEAPWGSETILLVEDDPGVADVMRETLVSKGYAVLATGKARDAMAVARKHEGPLHLLLSDIVLRGSRGVELATKLRELRPHLRVLFVSGYPDTGVRTPVLAAGTAFLQKPFTPEALANKVREVLDR